MSVVVTVAGTDLLRRNVERNGPQVDLRVTLDARQDEEDTYNAHHETTGTYVRT